jgi:hypothetical protein
MTNHLARLYALALGVLVFLVAWAAVAAGPFPRAKAAAVEPDSRLVALQKREARLTREQQRVNRLVERRFARYRKRLAERRREQAALDAAAAAAAVAASAVTAPAAPAAPSFAPAAPPPVQITTQPPVTSSGSS